ncbi:hypothetical protein [Cellulosimicrobium sp. Marseille-Q4280]|uniref:hypothetical protein n=1 Tax=Cellulosimicrobium sp. Marseille-Q4280 TaxID=2937992 RepID=UPI002042307C|nr:hypothetical protein [Cellulosimicrobium sp. Marseille-Q4280]
MQRRPSRFLSAALASVLGAAVALAVPAMASAVEPDLTVKTWERPAPGAAPSSDEVCTAQAQPVVAGQDPSLLPPSLVECFDTLEDALAHVTGSPVPAAEGVAVDDRAAVRAAVDSANARSSADARTTAAAASSLVLGLIHRDASYKGSQTLLWGKGGNGCFTGSTYGFPNMASFLQNNVISSAESVAGCWSTFYDAYSYGGDRRNCTPSCATMGSMDNRASSIVYRPKGQLG